MPAYLEVGELFQQELKEVNPQMYQAFLAATASMKFGSCADCEHCGKRVVNENQDERC